MYYHLYNDPLIPDQFKAGTLSNLTDLHTVTLFQQDEGQLFQQGKQS